MSNYAEKNLYENEWIVESAKRDRWGLIGCWILGVLFFWLLLIPTIIAVKKTVQYCCAELTVTTKRIVYKTGVFHTQAFDAPLDKIYNVYVDAGFWGRILPFSGSAANDVDLNGSKPCFPSVLVPSG